MIYGGPRKDVPAFKRLNKDIHGVIRADNGDVSRRWRQADNYRAYLWCNHRAPRCPFGFSIFLTSDLCASVVCEAEFQH